jgi:hypothetical protein
VNHLEGTKTVAKVSVAVATSGTHSHEIDTLGADYASIDVVFSQFTAATTSYASVLKLQQSNTSGSGQADVSGYTITAGAGATTGGVGAVARFNVDMRGRSRYLTVVATPGNAATISTVARLSKQEDMPITAAAMGVNDLVPSVTINKQFQTY